MISPLVWTINMGISNIVQKSILENRTEEYPKKLSPAQALKYTLHLHTQGHNSDNQEQSNTLSNRVMNNEFFALKKVKLGNPIIKWDITNVDEDVCCKYARRGILPPILIDRRGHILDGKHRTRAAIIRKDKNIFAYIARKKKTPKPMLITGGTMKNIAVVRVKNDHIHAKITAGVKGGMLRKGHSVLVKYGKDQNYIGQVMNDVKGSGNFTIEVNNSDIPDDSISPRGKKTTNKGVVSWCKRGSNGDHLKNKKMLTDKKVKTYKPDKLTLKKYKSGWIKGDRIVVYYSPASVRKRSDYEKWLLKFKDDKGKLSGIDDQSGFYIGTVTNHGDGGAFNFTTDHHDADSFKIGKIKTTKGGTVAGKGTDKICRDTPLPTNKLSLYFLHPEDVPIQPLVWMGKKLGMKPKRRIEKIRKYNQDYREKNAPNDPPRFKVKHNAKISKEKVDKVINEPSSKRFTYKGKTHTELNKRTLDLYKEVKDSNDLKTLENAKKQILNTHTAWRKRERGPSKTSKARLKKLQRQIKELKAK